MSNGKTGTKIKMPAVKWDKKNATTQNSHEMQLPQASKWG